MNWHWQCVASRLATDNKCLHVRIVLFGPEGQAKAPKKPHKNRSNFACQSTTPLVTKTTLGKISEKSILRTHRNPFDSGAASFPSSVMLAIADHCLFVFRIPSLFSRGTPSSQPVRATKADPPPFRSLPERAASESLATTFFLSAYGRCFQGRSLSACETDVRQIQKNFSQTIV